MFTDRFISRPVLAIAINVLLLVAGLAALASLQIRQFPRMQFTVITVTTVYTGASADLVQGFVTQPMQEQIAAADGVDYLTSESRSGQSTITVYMRLNYDTSAAQSNILAKIQAVRSDLPDDIEDPDLDISTGDVTQLIYFTLSSDQLNSAQITDYAKRVIQPKFSTVQGVSKIKYYGDREFAMRIWLDPRKLAVYQVSAAEVRQTIANNNYQTTAGQVRGQYNTFDIDAQTDLENPEDYGAIIVASGTEGHRPAARRGRHIAGRQGHRCAVQAARPIGGRNRHRRHAAIQPAGGRQGPESLEFRRSSATCRAASRWKSLMTRPSSSMSRSRKCCTRLSRLR